MKKDFILGEIANDFRHRFMTRLSEKAKANKWESIVDVSTNESQNAFYFSHKVTRCANESSIYDDVCAVLEVLNRDLFDFETKVHKLNDNETLMRGYEIHIEHIVYKSKGSAN